jgi:hypothetical protein
MARTGITCEQVFDTADTLANEGIQPTVKLVREKIGGSYSTITPHLAAWKDERAGKAVANVPDMPETVATTTRQAMHSVWVAAWKAGQDMIETERDGLTAARREMESERAEMAREITELETKLDTMASERDTIARSLDDECKQLKKAQDDLGRLRIENARLEERVINTEKRSEELRAQVERLEGELTRLAQGQDERQEGSKAEKKPKPQPKKTS